MPRNYHPLGSYATSGGQGPTIFSNFQWNSYGFYVSIQEYFGQRQGIINRAFSNNRRPTVGRKGNSVRMRDPKRYILLRFL